jgi:RNA polymerase sigma-70 factor (ECF subfamily)
MSETLADRIARARAAFPEFHVGDAELAAYLDERAADGVELDVEDLYLACACASGDAAAVRCFERRLAGDIDAALRHLRVADDLRDELKQRVRDKVLVGKPGARPKIADYSGRGALSGWLRAVATRTALDELRKGARAPSSEHTLLETIPAAIDDPETAALRERYAADFAAALRESLAALPASDRLLLKRHFVDGLSTEELGKLHRAHRVTVLRWLSRALDELATRAQGLLLTRLKLPQSEYESVIRLVRSQLDLSLGALLAPPERPK